MEKVMSYTIGSLKYKVTKPAVNGKGGMVAVYAPKNKKLKKVGAKVFKGIYKKAVIKVPKAKLKAYTKLLKKKGQAKTVKIKK